MNISQFVRRQIGRIMRSSVGAHFGFCGNSPAGGHPKDHIHEKLEPDLSQPSLTVSIATFVDVLATWGSVEMRSPRTRR
jgi:hypothetical protein